MDAVLLAKAAVMGIVEGLTEFLPISSTGHLIVVGSLIGFTGEVAKVFEIAIQTGAMFAVMWEYRARLLDTVSGLATSRSAQRFALNVIVAFAPAVVLGARPAQQVAVRELHGLVLHRADEAVRQLARGGPGAAVVGRRLHETSPTLRMSAGFVEE